MTPRRVTKLVRISGMDILRMRISPRMLRGIVSINEDTALIDRRRYKRMCRWVRKWRYQFHECYSPARCAGERALRKSPRRTFCLAPAGGWLIQLQRR